MDRESAKEMLACAATFSERADAVRAAIDAGMPLEEVEECFDWQDANRRYHSHGSASHGPTRQRSAISGR